MLLGFRFCLFLLSGCVVGFFVGLMVRLGLVFSFGSVCVCLVEGFVVGWLFLFGLL